MIDPIAIQLPTSKSISNRLLIIRELCETPFEIENISTSADTQLLVHILEDVRSGCNTIDVRDAGTVCRFMIALCAAAKEGEFLLSGSQRMTVRPQHDLIAALRQLGATIHCLKTEGYLPLKIESKGLTKSQALVGGNTSSQFISALCMLAPTLKNGLDIRIEGDIVSKPYIKMTLRLMESFGVVSEFNDKRINILQQRYQEHNIKVEADWSSAGFFFAAMIIQPTISIFLEDLQASGLQPDEAVIRIAEQFGVETVFHTKGCELRRSQSINLPKEIDFTDCPDLALPLMVAFALIHPTIFITGFHHLKYKESDRIQALKNELAKVDIHLHEEKGVITFKNNFKGKGELNFTSYNDHRVVMALNLFRLVGVKPYFDETRSVEKSFPNYFQEFDKLFQ